MNKYIYTFLISFCFLIQKSYADNSCIIPPESLQANESLQAKISASQLEAILTNTQWRVDQLYIDSIRINNSKSEYVYYSFVDSLIYDFADNGDFVLIKGKDKALGLWSVIYLSNGTPRVNVTDRSTGELVQTMDVIYYDKGHFIYTMKQLNGDGKIESSPENEVAGAATVKDAVEPIKENPKGDWHTIEFRMIPVYAQKCN